MLIVVSYEMGEGLFSNVESRGKRGSGKSLSWTWAGLSGKYYLERSICLVFNFCIDTWQS